MLIRFEQARPRRAVRDPTCLFNIEQLFSIAVALLLLGFVFSPKPLEDEGGMIIIIALAIPVFLQMLITLADIALEYLPTRVNKEKEMDGELGSFEITSGRREWKRVLESALNCDRAPQRFRTWLTHEQELVLFLIASLAVLVDLNMTDKARPFVLAIVLIFWSIVLLMRFTQRSRYLVKNNLVIMERLVGWRVVDTRQVNLKGAHVRANMAKGMLEIQKDTKVVQIALRELFNPHRFLAAILGNALDSKSLSAKP